MDISAKAKIKDKLIVDGYIRTNCLNQNRMNVNVPIDLADLIFLFYHIRIINECFQHYRFINYKPSDCDMVITKVGDDSVCYGSTVIPSISESIYQWIFRMIRVIECIAIGIDEATYSRKWEGGFMEGDMRSKFYTQCHDGEKLRWDNYDPFKTAYNDLRFGANDEVVMILDLSSKTLSYKINNGDECIAFQDIAIGHDVNYCMAVYIGAYHDSIELLSCSKW